MWMTSGGAAFLLIEETLGAGKRSTGVKKDRSVFGREKG